tara:strand:- start:455 stop:2422 length:1968 start_codon:yes stop_codon:yes gene_type:complete
MSEPKVVRGSSTRRTLQEKLDHALKEKGGMPYINKYGMDAKKLHQKLSQTRTVKGRGKRKSAPKIPNKSAILSKFAVPSKIVHTVQKVPDWFKVKHKKVDVSIIIPLHKSAQVIKDQIQKWTSDNDGLIKEIVYVSDCCPEHSEVVVVNEWTKRKASVENGVGQIIFNQSNVGFGPTCNMGAHYARGEYLLFLNADTVPTRNWIKPMYDNFKDESIGMVGNLQLRSDDGKIDSAGSEWSWKQKSFPHIGRNVWNSQSLNGAVDLKNAPSGMLNKAERDMVTGCCFMMPAKLFNDLEGFDMDYRIGYWEDADLCMRVKDEGYTIIFEPESIIYHKLGHAGSGGHAFMQHNRDKFWKRWGATGRIDSLVVPPRDHPPECDIKANIKGKVVGCIIACNEEEFLAPSVESLTSVVDEFIFVVGGNEYAYQSGMCNKNGYPNDNTLGIAKRLAKEHNGTVIEPPGRLWKDKVEMRNAYVEHLEPGNWMWMLDGDEVYKPRQLWRCTELMKEYEVIIMQFWLFWNNMNTIGVGKWEQYPQERIVKWRPDYAYRGSNHLHVSKAGGEQVQGTRPCYKGQEKLFYHYSWVRPIQKIRQKLLYYKFQSGNNNDIYVDDIFLKYQSNPGAVDGRTHPMGGGSFKPFPGIHPKEIQKLMKDGRFNF